VVEACAPIYTTSAASSPATSSSDYATTGDGLIAALQVLAVLVQSNRSASEAGRLFQPLPQRLVSIRFGGGRPLDNGKVKSAIRDGEATLGTAGRILVRKSGTEPVIRVMAEGEDEKLVGRIVDEIAAAIRARRVARDDTGR
jgi:phosphoglucosamine mutase